MKMKLIVLLLILIIALVAFFYPKKCGNWGTSLEATYEKCDCIGFKIQGYTLGGGYYYCYGICLENTCTPYKLSGTVGALPLRGWLFTVDTDTGRKLYFVAQFLNETTRETFYDKVLTEDQVKEIVNLTDIYPVTKQTQLTEEGAKKIVEDSIDSTIPYISSRYENYTFKDCVEGCMSPCATYRRAQPETNETQEGTFKLPLLEKVCFRPSGMITKEVTDPKQSFEIKSDDVDATIYCNAYGKANNITITRGYFYNETSTEKECLMCCINEECTQGINLCGFFADLDNCAETCDDDIKEISSQLTCFNSLKVGDQTAILYGTNRKPYWWLVSLYRDDIYYGYRSVDDNLKSFVSSCDYCIRASEMIYKVCDIPIDKESRNLLLQYMQENNIEGSITESFLFQYLVQNFDALRAVST